MRLSTFQGDKINFRNACGASANDKTKISVLAELPKRQNKKFSACGASANGKTKKLALAELPQTSKQKI